GTQPHDDAAPCASGTATNREGRVPSAQSLEPCGTRLRRDGHRAICAEDAAFTDIRAGCVFVLLHEGSDLPAERVEVVRVDGRRESDLEGRLSWPGWIGCVEVNARPRRAQ